MAARLIAGPQATALVELLRQAEADSALLPACDAALHATNDSDASHPGCLRGDRAAGSGLSHATHPPPQPAPHETIDLVFDGARYAVMIGFDPARPPGEVFVHGAKIGSAMDLLLDDGAVLRSLLQHGAAPADLARSLGRIEGTDPASILGALVAALAETDGR
jgi:hypothetical protein